MGRGAGPCRRPMPHGAGPWAHKRQLKAESVCGGPFSLIPAKIGGPDHNFEFPEGDFSGGQKLHFCQWDVGTAGWRPTDGKPTSQAEYLTAPELSGGRQLAVRRASRYFCDHLKVISKYATRTKPLRRRRQIPAFLPHLGPGS